jgi:YD repeat-containing protein
MDQQTSLASGHYPGAFQASREVVNFEAIFRIPPTHRLLVVRSRSRGGLVSAVYWEHEEYDASGRLIAWYKSFEEVSPAGIQQRGWCKYDGAGRLVAEADSLSGATVTPTN